MIKKIKKITKITTPLTQEVIQELKVGQEILLSGNIYTGRDAAHKRMTELLEKGQPLPIDVNGQAIYYAGPCPAPKGKVIGSVGPTTSGRMDVYSPRLIKTGLKIMIGKGDRAKPVIDAIKEHTGLYLAAVGGAGALISLCVEESEAVAFEDLGPEAIYRLKVKNLPLVVAIDYKGGNIYDTKAGTNIECK